MVKCEFGLLSNSATPPHLPDGMQTHRVVKVLANLVAPLQTLDTGRSEHKRGVPEETHEDANTQCSTEFNNLLPEAPSSVLASSLARRVLRLPRTFTNSTSG